MCVAMLRLISFLSLWCCYQGQLVCDDLKPLIVSLRDDFDAVSSVRHVNSFIRLLRREKLVVIRQLDDEKKWILTEISVPNSFSCGLKMDTLKRLLRILKSAKNESKSVETVYSHCNVIFARKLLQLYSLPPIEFEASLVTTMFNVALLNSLRSFEAIIRKTNSSFDTRWKVDILLNISVFIGKTIMTQSLNVSDTAAKAISDGRRIWALYLIIINGYTSGLEFKNVNYVIISILLLFNIVFFFLFGPFYRQHPHVYELLYILALNIFDIFFLTTALIFEIIILRSSNSTTCFISSYLQFDEYTGFDCRQAVSTLLQCAISIEKYFQIRLVTQSSATLSKAAIDRRLYRSIIICIVTSLTFITLLICRSAFDANAILLDELIIHLQELIRPHFPSEKILKQFCFTYTTNMERNLRFQNVFFWTLRVSISSACCSAIFFNIRSGLLLHEIDKQTSVIGSPPSSHKHSMTASKTFFIQMVLLTGVASLCGISGIIVFILEVTGNFNGIQAFIPFSLSYFVMFLQSILYIFTSKKMKSRVMEIFKK